MRIGFDNSSWTDLWMLLYPPASFVSENRTRIFSNWRWTLPNDPPGRLSISRTPCCSSRSPRRLGFEAFSIPITNPLARNWLRSDWRSQDERETINPDYQRRLFEHQVCS